MNGFLKVDHTKRQIIMSRQFAQYASNTMSPEYAHLQAVRQDYSMYTVVQRHIKQKETRECYRGLNYKYMEDYIKSHGSTDDLHTYNEMKLISECHSKAFRYPTIKAWFLERFPEVKQFGLKEKSKEEKGEESPSPVETPKEKATLALAA